LIVWDLFWLVIAWRMRWVGHVACMGSSQNYGWETWKEDIYFKTRCRWVDNIKIYLKERVSISIYSAFIWSIGVMTCRIWNLSIQKQGVSGQGWAVCCCEHGNELSGAIKVGNSLCSWATVMSEILYFMHLVLVLLLAGEWDCKPVTILLACTQDNGSVSDHRPNRVDLKILWNVVHILASRDCCCAVKVMCNKCSRVFVCDLYPYLQSFFKMHC
jgi:hypothetical protein